MVQAAGIQAPKFGQNFMEQYNVPDTNLTNKTTLSNNPLYNLTKVLFQGKQTDKLGEFANSDLFQQNGLNSFADGSNHKLFTKA